MLLSTLRQSWLVVSYKPIMEPAVIEATEFIEKFLFLILK